MEFSALKPWITTLAVPPAVGLLVLVLAGALWLAQYKRLGGWLGAAGVAVSWLCACSGFAIWLNAQLLPQIAVIPPNAIAASLSAARVQAIVVLGGGVQRHSREYGRPQPHAQTMARLQYGLLLARQSGLPLGFAGGTGWAGTADNITEAQAVADWLAQAGHPPLTWQDGSSKDTAQNARTIAPMLRQSGVERIALVTHAWHMPRSLRAFAATSLTTTPAPMGFIESNELVGLQWLPSAEGVQLNRHVWREALGLLMGAY